MRSLAYVYKSLTIGNALIGIPVPCPYRGSRLELRNLDPVLPGGAAASPDLPAIPGRCRPPDPPRPAGALAPPDPPRLAVRLAIAGPTVDLEGSGGARAPRDAGGPGGGSPLGSRGGSRGAAVPPGKTGSRLRSPSGCLPLSGLLGKCRYRGFGCRAESDNQPDNPSRPDQHARGFPIPHRDRGSVTLLRYRAIGEGTQRPDNPIARLF